MGLFYRKIKNNLVHVLCFSLHSTGSVSSVALLLQYGANVDQGAGDAGKTPLMASAQHANLDCVKLLAERTKNIDAINSYGETALFYAAQGSNVFLKAYPHQIKIATDRLQTSVRLASDPKIGVNGTMQDQCNPTALFPSLKVVWSQSVAI